MNKSVKCAVLSVLMVCCMVFSLPLTAFGVSRTYKFSFSEPPTGEGQGYVLLELYNTSNNSYYVQCFFWNGFLVGSSTLNEAALDTSMAITIENNTISFSPWFQSSYSYSACFSYFMSYEDSLNRYYYRDVSLPTETIYSYSFSDVYEIVSFKCLGDISSVEGNFSNRITFNVSWGETKLLLDELAVLISQMQESLQNDEELLESFNQLLFNTDNIETLLTDILFWTKACNDKLQVIKLRVDDIQELLEEIVNAQGESTFEEPDTSSIDDYNKAEGELVDGAEDTSDIEEEIGKFEIDVNASNSIWDIINRFLNSHPKVFGLAIGMLCLGIIALILNR